MKIKIKVSDVLGDCMNHKSLYPIFGVYDFKNATKAVFDFEGVPLLSDWFWRTFLEDLDNLRYFNSKLFEAFGGEQTIVFKNLSKENDQKIEKIISEMSDGGGPEDADK